MIGSISSVSWQLSWLYLTHVGEVSFMMLCSRVWSKWRKFLSGCVCLCLWICWLGILKNDQPKGQAGRGGGTCRLILAHTFMIDEKTWNRLTSGCDNCIMSYCSHMRESTITISVWIQLSHKQRLSLSTCTLPPSFFFSLPPLPSNAPKPPYLSYYFP